jgi:uncharacterized repeat protein (TIGR02059 family)
MPIRPIPNSYYYSGQGRLGIGNRLPDGQINDLVFVGNVTSLSLEIATQKFEHKESMSGLRGIDLTIVQERNATFSFTAESLILDLLSVGLYGSHSTVAGASNSVTVPASRGKAIPLPHPNVEITSILAGATPLVEDTDYGVDEGFGTVYILATSPVIASDDTPVTIAYTYGDHDKLEAFTTGTPPERFLRFEGLNTVNGDLRVIDLYRAAFDPLTGLEFINEELGSGEFAGTLLPDTGVVDPLLSQYFRERRVYASTAGTQPVSVVSTAVVTDAVDDDIVLTMSQALTSSSPAGAGGFTIAASGGAVTVSSVVVAGSTVTLNLSRAITAGEAVFLSYAPPGANNLANANGDVAAFVGRSVTNTVA